MLVKCHLKKQKNYINVTMPLSKARNLSGINQMALIPLSLEKPSFNAHFQYLIVKAATLY